MSAAVAWDESPPLRELAPYDEGLPATAAIGPPGLSVNGIGQGFAGPSGSYTVSSVPADASGDIGPNHYVQVAGQALAVFNRSGAPIYGPVPLNVLWSAFGGQCQTSNDGFHSVRYDRLADRWLITQFSVNGGSGPFYQCVAVSTGPDPTGSWYRYAFQYGAFNDFARIAVWPDAYYVTYNMFPNLQFGGAKVCAWDRARMLIGQQPGQTCFDTSTSYGGLIVAELEGTALPPAGAPANVLSLGISNDDLAYWKFHIDWAAPGNSTFVGPTTITVAAYTPGCNGGMQCVVQPGTTTRLDIIDDRPTSRAVYRRFADHETLLAIHDVTGPAGGSGIRWYELRNPGAATPTVFQQGTWAPDGAYRWMGAIAIDNQGGIGLAYSVSSAAIYPSLRYTGRLPGDPAGTMGQGEATLVVGSGSQTGNIYRWGDWSMMSTDPLDECTFWFTGEYMAATGSFNWRTRIGNFVVPNCVGIDNPPSTAIISPAAGAFLAGTVTLQATASDDLGVTGVDFLRGGVLIGSDATAPYSVDWDTTAVLDGPYTLTTVAHDTGGHATTSAGVGVTVDNPGGADVTPPVTSIARPIAGETVMGTARVAAKATDAVGVTRVDLYQGAALLGSATVPPYAVDWNTASVPDGSYSLTSRAYDAAGNEGVSAPVVITVHNDVTMTSLLKNGGFEKSLVSWTQIGPVAQTTGQYKTGTGSARIGSTTAFDGDASLAQSFVVPAAGVTTLRFWYLRRCDNDSVTYDQQEVLLLDAAGVAVATLLRTCATDVAWKQKVFDLTPWAGQALTVMFRDHDDGYAYDPTWFYVDAVSVKNVY